jgi:hypothetical protein
VPRSKVLKNGKGLDLTRSTANVQGRKKRKMEDKKTADGLMVITKVEVVAVVVVVIVADKADVGRGRGAGDRIVHVQATQRNGQAKYLS